MGAEIGYGEIFSGVGIWGGSDMTLTPVKLRPSCCSRFGEPISATELCCARKWIRGADVGNHTVKDEEYEISLCNCDNPPPQNAD